MIRLLASFFRGLSLIMWISAPAPDEDQRRFVFMWLGIIAILVGVAAILFYAMTHMKVP